jgi:hypothetical protein
MDINFSQLIRILFEFLLINKINFNYLDLMKKNVLNVIYVKKVLEMVQHLMVICVYMVDLMR